MQLSVTPVPGIPILYWPLKAEYTWRTHVWIPICEQEGRHNKGNKKLYNCINAYSLYCMQGTLQQKTELKKNIILSTSENICLHL